MNSVEKNNSRPIKVLLHGLNFLPEEIGVGKYSGEWICDLVERGCDATVVTTPPYYPHWKIGAGYSRILYRRDSKNGIDIVRCPLWVPKQVNGWKRVLHLASFGLSSIPVVLFMAIAKRPDIVIVVEPSMFSIPTSWIAARICGAKAWLHIQDFEVDAAFELGILKQPILKKCVLAIEAFLMRRFDRVSSISPKMLERLISKGVAQDRISHFPNWVDCNEIKPLENANTLRSQFGLPAGKCIALYAGNIGAKQGLDLILEVAKLCQDEKNLHFVICGHGAVYARIEEGARGMANVQLLPQQPSSVFNELMNCADIHLLPQRGDAADLVMPSKLTGMLASGRPIVSFAIEGTQIAEVVNGNGFVLPPGDVQGFARALLTLSENASLRESLGQNAREYALSHLGKKTILNLFYSELVSLLDKDVSSNGRVSP